MVEVVEEDKEVTAEEINRMNDALNRLEKDEVEKRWGVPMLLHEAIASGHV